MARYHEIRREQMIASKSWFWGRRAHPHCNILQTAIPASLLHLRTEPDLRGELGVATSWLAFWRDRQLACGIWSERRDCVAVVMQRGRFWLRHKSGVVELGEIGSGENADSGSSNGGVDRYGVLFGW
jgi:hypothetical protein